MTKQNKVIRNAAKKTVNEVLKFYRKANIPTIAEQKMAEKIEAFYKKRVQRPNEDK